MKPDIFTKIENVEDNMDLYYIALWLLMTKGGGVYNALPELCLALDEQNLERFLTIFGGRRIKIPTKAQVSNYTKAVITYYYIKVGGLSQKEALRKTNSIGNTFVRSYIKKLDKDLYMIGGKVKKDD